MTFQKFKTQLLCRRKTLFWNKKHFWSENIEKKDWWRSKSVSWKVYGLQQEKINDCE